MGTLPPLYCGTLDCNSHVVLQLVTSRNICCNALVNLLSAKERHFSGTTLETLRNALSKQMLL